jgi:predicted esterase
VAVISNSNTGVKTKKAFFMGFSCGGLPAASLGAALGTRADTMGSISSNALKPAATNSQM